MHIEAKAPAGFMVGPQNEVQARELLNTMLRSLLIERFRMKVHYEERPEDTYTLVAVKPKLTKADPALRTGCQRQNKPQNGTLIVTLTCRNMTMAQFAEQIRAYDIDIYYPVVDGTGLEGAWDFSVAFDAMAGFRLKNPGFKLNGAGDGDPGDPVGAYAFPDALARQLGLKLEVRKAPQQVFVIDHMEEWPADN